MKSIFLTTLIFTAIEVWAAPVSITEGSLSKSILATGGFYIDANENLNHQDFLKIDDTKLLSSAEVTKMRPYVKRRIWTKVRLTNTISNDINLILASNIAPGKQTKVWKVTGNTSKELEPLYTVKPSFPLPLKSGETAEFVFMSDTYITNVVNFSVKSQVDHFRETQITSILSFFFIGGAFAFFLYNIFMGFFHKSRVHIYYCGYLFSFSLLLSTSSGLIRLFSNDIITYYNQIFIFALGITLISALYFCSCFTQTSDHSPNLQKTVKFSTSFIAVFFAIGLTNLEPLFGGIFLFLPVLALGLIAIIGFRAVQKKVAVSKYFLLAWGCMFASIIPGILAQLNLIPLIIYSSELVMLGSLAEMSVFAFGLTDISEKRQKQISDSRITSLKKVATGLCHEVNNPLAIILGNSKIISRKIEKSDIPGGQLNKHFINIDKSGQRIVQILNILESFGDSKPILRDEVDTVQNILDDAVRLYYQMPSDIGKIKPIIYAPDT